MLRLVHCNGKSGRESLSRKLHLEKISLAIFILGYDFLPLENELVNCFYHWSCLLLLVLLVLKLSLVFLSAASQSASFLYVSLLPCVKRSSTSTPSGALAS